MLGRVPFSQRAVFTVVLLAFALPYGGTAHGADSDNGPLKILFLGDDGHHRPADRAAQLTPVLNRRNIHIEYANSADVLNAEKLNQFDGLLIYSNLTKISPDQEAALLDYVASGHGLIPLHCATACFLNSDKYIALVGAQFKTHGAHVFRTEVADTEHPILDGYNGFSSWDETYVHHRHNDDRTVLEYRSEGVQAPDKKREPWTWVRTHGKGRVFYTAWGHDQRTWSNAGFHNLVERGIRWACGQSLDLVADFKEREPFAAPPQARVPEGLKPFEYVEVGPKIPNYLADRPGTQGKPLTQMQKPLPADEAIQHVVGPAGFDIELYAADPDIAGKPISMNWDERGRLWVCETYDYPNELQPRGKGRDRIRICEDTDGDGKADQFTVFAESLSIPSTLVHYRGGVIVQDGIETLYLKDTDGDDKADVRTTLLTGWTLPDTHGGVSNFQYGLDNWIWGMQGYNNSAPVVKGEPGQSFRMGFFRFRLDDADPPNVTDFEFVRSTNNNTWGLGFSEEGLVFGSTANANPSIYMPIANRYYERVNGWAPDVLSNIADSYMFNPITEKIRQVDVHGGYTAAAGHAVYTARQYPSTWWNRTAFVCGPTGHLVGTFVLDRTGADVTSSSPVNLMASDDEWSAPIMAEVGPDGNVWVIDWYNYIVQHNPTPAGFETGAGNAYVNDLRDKKHGRIYRVTWKGDGLVGPAPDLANATAAELVNTLRHPTMLWRRHAQRLLVERGKTDVVPALVELVKDPSVDDIGLNPGAIHALRTLEGLGVLEQPGEATRAALAAGLEHPSAGVRRNAIEVLPDHPQAADALLKLNLTDDADAQVRLAALLALSDIAQSSGPSDAAAQKAAQLATDAAVMSDRWLADAVASAGSMQGVLFLSALAKQTSPPGQLHSAGKPSVAGVAARHVARSEPTAETIEQLMNLLAAAKDEVRLPVLEGLADGWPTDANAKISPAGEQRLADLIETLPAAGQGRLIRLATLWGSNRLDPYAEKIATRLMSEVADEDKSVADRVAAAEQVVRFRPHSDDVVTDLLDLLGPQLPSDLADGVIGALVSSRADGLASSLIAKSAEMTPAMKSAAIKVFTARKETILALLDALNAGQLDASDLALDQRQVLASHPDMMIRHRSTQILRRRGGLPNPDRERVVKSLEHVLDVEGDAAAGKQVFTKHCAVCHTHSGEGKQIGPDLTGMAVHPAHELLTQILDPSRSVESNFRQYTVVTNEGLTVSGMLATETKTTIELIDTQGKRHTIPRDEIDEFLASKKSVMPEGFEKQLKESEFSDLLAFLTKRGRYLPLPLNQAATAVTTRGMYLGSESVIDRLMMKEWTSRTVNEVPFTLIDPQGTKIANAIALYTPNSPDGKLYPQAVNVPCNSPVAKLHLLGGIGGYAYPREPKDTVTMIVELQYEDGEKETHELKNGQHIADFLARTEVPKSKFAFLTDNGRQVRYLTVEPKRDAVVKSVNLIKGPDKTSPIILAITAELP